MVFEGGFTFTNSVEVLVDFQRSAMVGSNWAGLVTGLVVAFFITVWLYRQNKKSEAQLKSELSTVKQQKKAQLRKLEEVENDVVELQKTLEEKQSAIEEEKQEKEKIKSEVQQNVLEDLREELESQTEEITQSTTEQCSEPTDASSTQTTQPQAYLSDVAESIWTDLDTKSCVLRIESADPLTQYEMDTTKRLLQQVFPELLSSASVSNATTTNDLDELIEEAYEQPFTTKRAIADGGQSFDRPPWIELRYDNDIRKLVIEHTLRDSGTSKKQFYTPLQNSLQGVLDSVDLHTNKHTDCFRVGL